MVSKQQLALDAIHVEQEMIRENVGSQDQVAAAFGGFNRIDFWNTNRICVKPITIAQEKLKYLQDNILFYFTGFSRYSNEIAREQIERTPNRLKELKLMSGMVDEAANILNGRENGLDEFGKLLHEAWMLKRSLTGKISNGHIDRIYEAGRSAGALGGKLCGAGGGGFMLFFATGGDKGQGQGGLEKTASGADSVRKHGLPCCLLFGITMNHCRPEDGGGVCCRPREPMSKTIPAGHFAKGTL